MKRPPKRILGIEAICGSCTHKTASHYTGSRRPCRVKGCACRSWTKPTIEQVIAAREARA